MQGRYSAHCEKSEELSMRPIQTGTPPAMSERYAISAWLSSFETDPPQDEQMDLAVRGVGAWSAVSAHGSADIVLYPQVRTCI